MKDITGKEIEVGQTLERVVDGAGTQIGHKYVVIQRDWSSGGEGEDLIASGGFINELLWPERAKEFKIVNE